MQKYIVEHFNGDISPDDLSRAGGYSKYHAARIFRELTGKSPSEYAPELAPYFNFGAGAKTGAKMARPVKKVC